jgi:hypothetical protein
MVRRVQREGRAVFVHLDLIDGLSNDQHGLRRDNGRRWVEPVTDEMAHLLG